MGNQKHGKITKKQRWTRRKPTGGFQLSCACGAKNRFSILRQRVMKMIHNRTKRRGKVQRHRRAIYAVCQRCGRQTRTGWVS